MQTSIKNFQQENTDLNASSADLFYDAHPKRETGIVLVKYLILGILFGVILVKSEVISWYRIQEMFRLQSFHMYGVMISAVITGIVSVWLIKKFTIKTIHGEKIVLPDKRFSKGQIYGGLVFGFGWAITGACPGPLFAQVGAGSGIMLVPLLSAIAGTWLYGYVKEKLPH